MEAHVVKYRAESCRLQRHCCESPLIRIIIGLAQCSGDTTLEWVICKCLRKITRIRPSFVSRASNAKVLMRAHEHPQSSYLHYQQLLLFGRVARAPAGDVLRRATFHHGLESATNRYVRRVGRPRNEWARMLREEACKMSPQYESLIRDVAAWKQAVRKFSFCV